MPLGELYQRLRLAYKIAFAKQEQLRKLDDDYKENKP